MRIGLLAMVVSIVFTHAAGVRAQTAANGDLVGAWSSTTMYVDKNRNSKLEESERGDLIAGSSDFLRLNADGSCEFYTIKVKGRYELQTRSDGSRKLIIFDKDNNKVDKGLVVSVSKDELVLLNLSTRGFSVYKRQ